VAVEADAADKANKTDDACEAGAAEVNEADVAVKPDEADEAFDAKVKKYARYYVTESVTL